MSEENPNKDQERELQDAASLELNSSIVKKTFGLPETASWEDVQKILDVIKAREKEGEE